MQKGGNSLAVQQLEFRPATAQGPGSDLKSCAAKKQKRKGPKTRT